MSTVILKSNDRMENQVEEVKQKTDIVAVIGERVNLKKAGSNFKGLCPFHNEKSPSFMVSPELQIFKCFGCQKSGDVFTFLQEYEGMDFYEALKSLADRAGLKLKTLGGDQRGIKDRLYEVNSIASRFYHYILLRHPAGKIALEYLTKHRKLTPASIEQFSIGYSPDVPLALKNYVIERNKVTLKELVDVGLIYSSRGRNLDRFRGRVIFPLFDHRGNTVGFAGRILANSFNKDLAKYINTPETLVYKKSQVLFGLNESRSEIKKSGFAVIVEGELDMISAFQAGIRNVVAIKGSVLTEEQSKLLSRFTKTVVLALDTDFAGNEAAKRGIFVAEREGLQVQVAEIKGFKDPDEAAQKDPEKLKSFIKNAIGVWDFIINFTFSKYKNLGGEQKTKIASELIPLLAQIDNKITQSHYISQTASKLGVPMDAVQEEIKKVRTNKSTLLFRSVNKESEDLKDRRVMLEESYLNLIFKVDPKILLEKKYSKLLATPFAKRMLEELTKHKGNLKIADFVKVLPSELRVKFTDLVLKDVNGFDEGDENKLKKEIETLRQEIKILAIKVKLKSLSRKIREAENTKDKISLKKAEKKFSLLTKKLSRLKEDF